MFNQDQANIDPLIERRNNGGGGPSGSTSPQLRIVDSKFSMSPGRQFRERAFSKINDGSVRGSIFTLCASAIGSGVLSLPYVLNLCGYVAGICFLCLGAAAA